MFIPRIVLRWWTEAHVWQEEGGGAVWKGHQNNGGSFGKKKRITRTACSVAQVSFYQLFFEFALNLCCNWLALSISHLFSRVYLRFPSALFFSRLATLTCFPALSISDMFSRVCYQPHVFPRLAERLASAICSYRAWQDAWHQPHIFPRLVPAGYMYCFTFWLVSVCYDWPHRPTWFVASALCLISFVYILRSLVEHH